jgi:hypothetical protein
MPFLATLVGVVLLATGLIVTAEAIAQGHEQARSVDCLSCHRSAVTGDRDDLETAWPASIAY